jgi:hypothetical protein
VSSGRWLACLAWPACLACLPAFWIAAHVAQLIKPSRRCRCRRWWASTST